MNGTRENDMNFRKEQLILRLTAIVNSGKELTEKFKSDLDKDPCHTLEWADGYIEGIARVELAKELLKGLSEPGVTFEQVKTMLQNRLAEKAMFPSRSTSPSCNRLAEARLTALAYTIELLSWV
jgi:hypothetical protein